MPFSEEDLKDFAETFFFAEILCFIVDFFF